MAAYVYANGQYHCLAGNKIVKDGALLDMKAADKIIVNGKAYNLGFGGAGTPGTPSVPDAPECNITHDNGTEPTTGNVFYITPDGAGSMDGSSWANAASGSMIHVILLSCASGDRVYFAEGDYTADRTLTLPSGVSLFGGFTAENPTWATRDAFAHPTVWTASHTGAWLESKAYISGQLVDGFTLVNYADTVSDAVIVTFRNGFVSGGTFTWGGTVENSRITVATLDVRMASGCWISGGTVTATNTEDCIVIGASSTVENALRTDFYFGATSVTASANTVNVYGTEAAPVTVYLNKPSGCKVVYGKTGNLEYIFGGTITNCTAVNCTGTSSSYIFYSNSSTITNCTAVNCTSTSTGTSSSYIFYGNSSKITNCTAVNCTSTGNDTSIFYSSSKITNCTAVNCTSTRYIFYGYGSYGSVTNCTAVNCTSARIFYGYGSSNKITNCTAVNCTGTSSSYIFYGSGSVKNCLSWNNSGTEFAGTKNTCAGSVYDADLALVLGTDNSIARFTNTGFAPAQGVQDVGNCPSPIDDPDGYAEWLAAFGDWHPAANSFLLGAGTADSSVTTDADGVTRPDPPSIGAYEAR